MWEEIEQYVERVRSTVSPNASYTVLTLINKVHQRTSKFRETVEKYPEQEGLLNALLSQVSNKIDTSTQTSSRMVSDMVELDALYNHAAAVISGM